MSLKDLLQFSGIPGLHAAVSILTATHDNLDKVKLYKQQCRDLNARSIELMVALQENAKGLEGTKILEKADEIEAILRRINRKVSEWSSHSKLRSFLQQSEIRDGIDCLNRDLDAAFIKFQINIGMNLALGQIESQASRERDKEEMRELLTQILRDNEAMRALINIQSPVPVETMMTSLQTELKDSDLEPKQEEAFRDGLYMLFQKTSKLPPLPDLTGQITPDSHHGARQRGCKDILSGEWLNHERVALHSPRPMLHDSAAQKRFLAEVEIWRGCEHTNVVPLYGIVDIQALLYLVSPCMDNGTAIEFVTHRAILDPTVHLRILSDVALGLEYLHDKNIVHGDLRGANILISADGVARISGLGLSKMLENNGGHHIPSSADQNPRWFAPEYLMKNGQMSMHSDIWSFAMVCLEILTGQPPYANYYQDATVVEEVLRGKMPERPKHSATAARINDEMWTLLKKCWNRHPAARPNISYVKNMLLHIRGSGPHPDGAKVTTARRAFTIFRPKTRAQHVPPPVVQSSNPPMSVTSKDGSLRTFGTIKTRGDDVFLLTDEVDSEFHGFKGAATKDFVRVELPTRLSRSNHLNRLDFEGSMSQQHLPTKKLRLEAALQQAVSSQDRSLYLDKLDSVALGTLEGLVDRLTTNFNFRKDIEYRDIFLTTCGDFTTSENVYSILARRFHEAETDLGRHLEDRVALQYNIFMVLLYWVEGDHLPIDQHILIQMKQFCISSLRSKTSLTMQEKISELLKSIEIRLRKTSIDSSLLLSPGRRIPDVNELQPHDLAIALTLLEGAAYKNIQPGDYIAHLKRSGHNNIEAASQINNKIVMWIKESLLFDCLTLEERGESIKFYINTAEECRKYRNFSSLIAIAIALHSAPIEKLKYSIDYLPDNMKQLYANLEDICKPACGHAAYKQALASLNDPSTQNICVPWLAVHLRELHHVFHYNPIVIEMEGQPLINFQRYIRFTDRVREIMRFTPPDLARYQLQGPLMYLQDQLRNVSLGPDVEARILERSNFLGAQEETAHNNRTRELTRLGFAPPKYP